MRKKYVIPENSIEIEGLRETIVGSPSDYFTINQLCKMFSVSKQFLQRRILSGKISAIKFGQKYLVHKNEVDRIARYGVQ